MSNAKFFNQVWTVANSDKTDFDKVEFAQEWAVLGDCNSTATIANCSLYNKTFGTSATAGAMKKFYVTRGSMAEAWDVTYDDKVMGNAKAQTLNDAKHTGAMTNKVSLWTGVAATATATGWSTVKVESNASKANSLGVHPSTSTYGFTVIEMTSANL